MLVCLVLCHLEPLDLGHLEAGLDPQCDGQDDTSAPKTRANVGDLGVVIVLYADVDDVVGDAAEDVTDAEDVELAGGNAGDVGGNDGSGEEAEGLEAVFGCGLGAEDALFLLRGVCQKTKRTKKGRRGALRTCSSMPLVLDIRSFTLRGFRLSYRLPEAMTEYAWGTNVVMSAAGTCVTESPRQLSVFSVSRRRRRRTVKKE